jgi:hypothetical protein
MKTQQFVTQKQLDALTAFLERCKRNGVNPASRVTRITIGENEDGEPVFVIKHPPRVN